MRRQVRVVIDILAGNGEMEHVAVAENAGLAGLRQNDELVREISADGPGFGGHGDGVEPHACKGAQIGNEHLVVGNSRGRLVEVEGIGVFHQELAAAHYPETGPLLVAEFPLDVIEDLRQLAIGANVGAEDLGDHLLVGGPVKHVAFMAILDAQHFRAVGVVASALAPKIGKLQRGHQELDGTRAVLLLAHDLLDLLEHAKAEGQPSVDPGGLLADEPRAQHEPVRDDLRFLRGLAQNGQEVAGKAHERIGRIVSFGVRRVKPDRRQKDKGYQSLPVNFAPGARRLGPPLPRRNSARGDFTSPSRI